MRIASDTRLTVGIVPGDPNGIGPEVLVKAWAAGRLNGHCRPVVIGSPSVIENAVRLTGVPLRVRGVDSARDLSGDDGVIDVLASAPFDAAAIRFGTDQRDAGAATGLWLDHADRLAREGALDATVMGPISSQSLELAGKMGAIATNKAEAAYLVLRSGRLVIAHLTDHIALRDVPGCVTEGAVSALITRLAAALAEWGVGEGRIAVAGLNPHAKGTEETLGIEPAVAAARAAGLSVEGPISPDSVFRHCIDGRYDAVVAMYHDQGHIPMKTWGFSGNSVVILGPPYLHTTVAHGVAYDLAGTGRADSSMLLAAILDASHLSAGRGFHVDPGAAAQAAPTAPVLEKEHP